jgi:AmiR/NasT family two-component response regulator
MTTHLSARLAWHDRGWNGAVCSAPHLNASCVALRHIRKGRNDERERRAAGAPFADLRGWQPPCGQDAAAFAPRGYSMTYRDPLEGRALPPVYDLSAHSRHTGPMPPMCYTAREHVLLNGAQPRTASATRPPPARAPRLRIAGAARGESSGEAREGSMTTRIIIAEDDSVIRMDLREELQRQGYLVVGDVGDGQSAVNLARELRPDLVVMDIRMPQMDGIEAARILTNERLAPTVLLTAFSDDELVERAREAGVVAYITKPWKQSDLKPAIEIALSRFQEFREMESQVKTLEDQLATRKVVEKAKGVLMTKFNLTEQEAFRRIQKLSMNNRKSMREVAEAILLAEELGG